MNTFGSARLSRRAALKGIGLGAVSLAALAACGADDGGSSSGGVTNITMWGSWSGDQIAQLNQQLAAYNAAQTKIKATYVAKELVEQSLLTAIAGGGVPDIVLWDRYQTALYASKGALAPVDDLVARDSVDLGQFYQPPLTEMKVGGKLYGLPLLVDNRSLFYNKTQLTQAGVKPPTTWAELAEAASALTVRENGKLKRAGFAVNDVGLFNIWIRQAGGQLVSADGTKVAFNSEAGLAVLAFWDELLHQRKVYELGFGEGSDPFAEQNVSMKYDGPWALAGLDKVSGLDYGIVEPVKGPKGDQGAITGGFGLVIPKGAKNVDAAWEFAKWWTTQPANGVNFAKISGWIPAATKAANDPYFTGNDHYKAFIATMNYAQIRPSTTGYSDVEGQALIPALQKFVAGELSAKDALAQAEQQGNAILAQNR
jgi:multiple sugar transport system substrate-binding protein